MNAAAGNYPMDTTAVAHTGIGSALLGVFWFFAIAVLVLWILLPFAVFGIKPLLRNVLDTLHRIEVLLTSEDRAKRP